MNGRYVGLIEYLAGALEKCGHFKVVACPQQEHAGNQVDATEQQVIQIIADESDNEICVIRSLSPEKDSPILNFKTFYQTLTSKLNEYPEYSLRVSEYFQIDDEYSGRSDMPLAGAEVDEAQEVIRLLF